MSVLALSSGQKAGILVVALVFIGFALVSSFVLSRRNPDFPGRRVGLFSIVAVALFVAMMTAMVTLAREDEEEGDHAAATGEVDTSGGEPAGGGEDTTGGETQPPAPAAGDAAAGEEVFASTGCGSCHTLSAAGSTGTIGPNLDESQPDAELVVDRVTNGSGEMPSFKDQLSETDIQNVAAYVVESTSGS